MDEQYGERVMAVTAVIKFKINNDFFEWEKAFYEHQPRARKSGIYELYHGHGLDDPKSLVVVMMAPSPDAMDQFMAENRETIAVSGHILESSEVSIYTN